MACRHPSHTPLQRLADRPPVLNAVARTRRLRSRVRLRPQGSRHRHRGSP